MEWALTLVSDCSSVSVFQFVCSRRVCAFVNKILSTTCSFQGGHRFQQGADNLSPHQAALPPRGISIPPPRFGAPASAGGGSLADWAPASASPQRRPPSTIGQPQRLQADHAPLPAQSQPLTLQRRFTYGLQSPAASRGGGSGLGRSASAAFLPPSPPPLTDSSSAPFFKTPRLLQRPNQQLEQADIPFFAGLTSSSAPTPSGPLSLLPSGANTPALDFAAAAAACGVSLSSAASIAAASVAAAAASPLTKEPHLAAFDIASDVAAANLGPATSNSTPVVAAVDSFPDQASPGTGSLRRASSLKKLSPHSLPFCTQAADSAGAPSQPASAERSSPLMLADPTLEELQVGHTNL